MQELLNQCLSSTKIEKICKIDSPIFDNLEEAYRLRVIYKIWDADKCVLKIPANKFTRTFRCSDIDQSYIFLSKHPKIWHPDIYDAKKDMELLRVSLGCTERELYKTCYCYSLLFNTACTENLILSRRGTLPITYVGSFMAPWYESCSRAKA